MPANADGWHVHTEIVESKTAHPMKTPTNAFILRQSPSGKSLLESVSLKENVIVNGWSGAKGLIEVEGDADDDYWRFRDILKRAVYSKEPGYRKAGYAAATMWRFIKEMKPGDFVVVPHWGGVFYVAEVTGRAYYDGSNSARESDSCYRRAVRWLNGKQPISRGLARSRLVSRMKTQQTSASAEDLLPEIVQALKLASSKDQPKAGGLFVENLRSRMVESVQKEILDGHMDERKFELLVIRVLLASGANDATLIPRLKDKGVDIIAIFQLGRISQVKVGVQVKYHRGVTENHWIDQLARGIEEENLSTGWLITSGETERDAQDYLERKFAGTSVEVSLVDGEQLAGMIVDCGLEEFPKA